jgi:hypothetical protein
LRTFSVCAAAVCAIGIGAAARAEASWLWRAWRCTRTNQRGKIVAKGLGDDFLRLVQMIAGVDQIAGGLHRLRAADAFQNAGHGIRMRKNVLAGV